MELWQLDASDLARLIRLGQVSSREAVTSSLARTDVVNPKLNAVVHRMDDEALAAADACDAARARGEVLGALHGVPVTTKINVDQRGHPTDNGAVALKDLIAPDDSPVVANLRKAGAVIIGRTNTPAFSWRWFTDNDLHGRTYSPWDRAITPGGSSGGAAAAVAAGNRPHRTWQRHRRLGALSGLCLRHRGYPPDARAHPGFQPLRQGGAPRHRPARLGAGTARPLGAGSQGLSARHGSARRARSLVGAGAACAWRRGTTVPRRDGGFATGRRP